MRACMHACCLHAHSCSLGGPGRGALWRSIQPWLWSRCPVRGCNPPSSCSGRWLFAHEGLHWCTHGHRGSCMHVRRGSCMHAYTAPVLACMHASPVIPQAFSQACCANMNLHICVPGRTNCSGCNAVTRVRAYTCPRSWCSLWCVLGRWAGGRQSRWASCSPEFCSTLRFGARLSRGLETRSA